MTVSHVFHCASIIAMHVLSVCHTNLHADGSSKIQLMVTRLSVCDMPSRAEPAVYQKLKLGGGGGRRGVERRGELEL